MLLPLVRYKSFVYRLLGVGSNKCFFIGAPKLIGSYSNLVLKENAEIAQGCFLVAKDKIYIGENSTLAYGVTILTTADPNGPKNKLSELYPAISEPVVIGDDCWIGARALILPGVKIGNRSVVAAGSIVTKDVPEESLVAGIPAVVKKKLIFNA